jgi:hypothetical protein
MRRWLRASVEQAIEAVGPELAGVLIDVCCFRRDRDRGNRTAMAGSQREDRIEDSPCRPEPPLRAAA